MNNRTKFTAYLLLFAVSLVWLDVATAKGPKVKVEQAIPGEAEQGRQNLPVKIKGQNFRAGDGVRFLVTDTSDYSQVDVLSVVFDEATGDLDTVINVSETATVSDYDIEIQRSGGRGGKGTGLFKVSVKGGGGGQPHLGDDYTATDGVTFINPSDVGSFDYHIIGTSSPDDIYGGGGADLIEGGDGHDNIWAREGDDEIHAGAGNGDIMAGDGNDDIYGGDGSDEIRGDNGDDFIFGGANDDTLMGGSGTDWLEGGDGHDWLMFSLGSFDTSLGQYEVDHYDGNGGDDTLHFSHGYVEDLVEGVILDMESNSYEATVRDPSGTLVTVNGEFSGIEKITGSPGNDVLLGDESDNVLNGDGGDNFIYGYGGNDLLASGHGNNVVYGGSGNDWITTGTGTDILFGEAGDDILEGYRGDDEIHGGEGCDIYVFDLEHGTDTIMGFEDCEQIYMKLSEHQLKSFRRFEINPVGNDIVIDVVTRGRGSGTKIILKDAALNGVTVDGSNLKFGRPGDDRDCSRYWCSPSD